MRDVLPTLIQWASEGRRFALATVTQTWGSSPRPLGSVMGVRDDGQVVGSVSGGCVEGAVIEASLEALTTNTPKELVFDAQGDDIWEVGLSCGGKIQVWIAPDPTSEPWNQIVEGITNDQPALVIHPDPTIAPNRLRVFVPLLSSPEGLAQEATSLDPSMDCIVTLCLTPEILQSKESQLIESEGNRYFLQVLTPREKLLIIGAVHIAVPLIKFAKELGFHTILIDPRATFSTPERFETPPDETRTAWPEHALRDISISEETYAVVLTHDPKIDDPALKLLLNSPARYIGALGSRTTQGIRNDMLEKEGFTREQIQRIHGPIGLPIGARSPEEIALAIMAEIIQTRRAR